VVDKKTHNTIPVIEVVRNKKKTKQTLTNFRCTAVEHEKTPLISNIQHS
jgi:hypothetical protein